MFATQRYLLRNRLEGNLSTTLNAMETGQGEKNTHGLYL
jgi:hypothetical protein